MSRDVDKIGLIVFDLDGTLFETDRVTVPAVETAFRRVGYESPSREEILSFIGKPGSDFHGWLRKRAGAAGIDELLATVDELELRYIGERGRLYAGVLEMLAALRETVEQMLICTNGTARYVKRVVAAHDLDFYFQAIRYRQSPEDTKPGMLGELMGRFGARPVVVVGDRVEDLEAARKNGASSIAVEYGFGSEKELSSADATAEAPSRIPGLVRELTRAE